MSPGENFFRAPIVSTTEDHAALSRRRECGAGGCAGPGADAPQRASGRSLVRMSRTNVDIDDELVAEAMRRYRLATKRAAIDLALRRLVGDTMSRGEALAMEGSGWGADLAELRTSTPTAPG